MSLPLDEFLEEQYGEKVLSLFLTAGYPRLETTVAAALALHEAGADLIELGMPFSDPLADGPTIQEASNQALANGVTVSTVLEMAGDISDAIDAPVILMGYYNPIMQYGITKFVDAAQAAGVRGLIVPDLLVDESGELRDKAKAREISLIYLVAPNTPPSRLELIDRLTTSFVYATSVTGVTGARHNVADQGVQFLAGLRRHIRHPILVGFGVSTPDDAHKLSRQADGVIIGSALIQRLKEHSGKPGGEEKIMHFVREMKNSLREESDGDR